MLRNAALLAFLTLTLDAYCQIIIDITPRVASKAAIQKLDRQTGKTFVQRQRKHAKALLTPSHTKRAGVITGVPAADALNVYTAPLVIGAGSGAQSYDLLIDTGSSFTWVGSGKPYTQTADARDQNTTFSIAYGSGSASGEFFKATCHFSGVSGTTMNNQGYGVASSSSGFGNVDGILGLGPTSLSRNTVAGVSTVPTVIDTLKAQKRISNAIVAASFAPNTAGTTAVRGSLALGGVDPSKFKAGTLVYAPKLSSNPYWGARVNRFTYNTPTTATATLGAANPTGIVDTGTTLLLLPDNAFQQYMAAVPGSYIDSQTGLTMVPRSSYVKMGNLTIFWNSKPFTLIADAQLMPPALGELFEASNPNNDFVSIVASSGSSDYTIGMLALTRFYSVFDTPNNRIGLAYTVNTFQRTSGIAPVKSSASSAHPSTTKKPKPTSTKHPKPTKKPTSPCNDVKTTSTKKSKRSEVVETGLARHRRDSIKRAASF